MDKYKNSSLQEMPETDTIVTNEEESGGNRLAENKVGKNIIDFLSDLFPKKVLSILAGLFLIVLIALGIYVLSQAIRGREAKIFGYGLGEDPYLPSNIDATCAAKLPTTIAANPSVLSDLQKTFRIESPTPSIKSTLSETPVPTYIPTTTPTVTPTATLGLEDGCISEEWQVYPDYLLSFKNKYENECMNFSKLGFRGINNGFEILVHPTSAQGIYGIYKKVSLKETQINFTIYFKEIIPVSMEEATKLFIGFIDPMNKVDLDGQYLVLQDVIEDPDYLPFVLFDSKVVVRGLHEGNEIKVQYTIDEFKGLECIFDFQGDKKYISDVVLSDLSSYFFIGYSVPGGSKLSVQIKDLYLIEK